ncbi:MAG: glutamate--tRNA ligase [Elusimicrobiota bacterium]
MTNIRVRFAPSPTGFLHVGGARTAVFNWLFARHCGGKFILRIEDTDEVRSTPESVTAILQGMSWLGLNWDEGPVAIQDFEVKLENKGGFGPYFQMERLAIYQKYARQLLAENKAYHCYCSPEELALARAEAMKEKRPPKYQGRCRNLTAVQQEALAVEGRKPVIRFKTALTGTTKVNDLIRGEVGFDNRLLDDFVILKSSGIPVYNFAVTVDDHLMEISHVLRGDDHLSNTPRQILLYQAFDWGLPQFAHFPMILGPDGSRLSKRHGATSVGEYEELGYLPEALVNYLALLGWSTEDSRQLFTVEELIAKFSLEQCSKSAAIFDPKKLHWMNGEYVRKMPLGKLVNSAEHWLKKTDWFAGLNRPEADESIKKAVALEHEKVKLLSDVPALIDFFFKENMEYDQKALDKVFGKNQNALKILREISGWLQVEENFTAVNLESLVRRFAEEKNIKTGEIFHPLRVAVSGRTTGPSLFTMLELLGKEKIAQRIEQTLTRLVA